MLWCWCSVGCSITTAQGLENVGADRTAALMDSSTTANRHCMVSPQTGSHASSLSLVHHQVAQRRADRKKEGARRRLECQAQHTQRQGSANDTADLHRAQKRDDKRRWRTTEVQTMRAPLTPLGHPMVASKRDRRAGGRRKEDEQRRSLCGVCKQDQQSSKAKQPYWPELLQVGDPRTKASQLQPMQETNIHLGFSPRSDALQNPFAICSGSNFAEFEPVNPLELINTPATVNKTRLRSRMTLSTPIRGER